MSNDEHNKLDELSKTVGLMAIDIAVIKSKVEGIPFPLNCSFHQIQLTKIEDDVKDTNVRVTSLEKWSWKKEGALIVLIGLITLFGSQIVDVIFPKHSDNPISSAAHGQVSSATNHIIDADGYLVQ